MSAVHPLDNAPWQALTTLLAPWAERYGSAARFRDDVGIFCAVERWDRAGWADLAHLVGPDGIAVFLQVDVPAAAPGWTELDRGPGLQMVLEGAPARAPLDPAVHVRPLDVRVEADVDAAVDLVALTEPGPFRRGTLGLGSYLGAFAGGSLVAMAGERMRLPGWTEVSAVCTHPDWRGRGLAAALTRQVADAIQAQGDRVVLHVAADNPGAARVYRRLGFVVRREIEWCAVRSPDSSVTSSGSDGERSGEDPALQLPHGELGDGRETGG